MTRRLLYLVLALLLTLTACDFEGTLRSSEGEGGGSETAQGEADTDAPDPENTELPELDLSQNGSDAPPTTVTEVVEEALPSVVNVRVKNLGRNVLTGEFEEGQGQGSGVIVDEDGIIVTNNHVIAGAVDVNVVFNDGRDPLEGQVIGAIPENDLAIIQVQADDLDAIELGKSDNLDLGESVVAIGFPLGLGGPTVTQGIISGLERTIRVNEPEGPQSLEGLLQTDAAINPGNSGGALVDMAGRLVGINTAAITAASAENIGFAIAIDEAIPVVEEILEDPPEERAWLGVSLGSIESASAAVEFGLDDDARGAVIMGIVPESPAEESGLEEGDLIVSIGGDEIASADDVTEVLRDRDPGESVEIGFVREGSDESVELDLGSRPAVFDQDRG
jgi:S1-C subfamily serine protease